MKTIYCINVYVNFICMLALANIIKLCTEIWNVCVVELFLGLQGTVWKK